MRLGRVSPRSTYRWHGRVADRQHRSGSFGGNAAETIRRGSRQPGETPARLDIIVARERGRRFSASGTRVGGVCAAWARIGRASVGSRGRRSTMVRAKPGVNRGVNPRGEVQGGAGRSNSRRRAGSIAGPGCGKHVARGGANELRSVAAEIDFLSSAARAAARAVRHGGPGTNRDE